MNDEARIVVAAQVGLRIVTAADIQDALGATFGARGLLVTESDLDPAFLDLRSGLLGELLQKFVNYRVRLALVVADPARHGVRLAELAGEHRTHGHARIFPNEAEACAWLFS